MVGQFDSSPIDGYIQELNPQPTETRFYSVCPHCGQRIELVADKTDTVYDYGNDDGYKEGLRNPNTTAPIIT